MENNVRQGGQFSSVRGILSLLAIAFILAAPIAVLAGAGNQPWPQYTNIAPLPGAICAISPDGDPDGLGALQINIPVAFTPSTDCFCVIASAGDYSNGQDQPFGNGSGVLGMSVGGEPRLYISAMQVSRDFSETRAYSGQLSIIPETKAGPAISAGMQDILEKESNGRSPYIVATKSLSFNDHRIFATLGYGGGRFLDRPFAGLSSPLNESFNLGLEWDGFQINSGIGWRPHGRFGRATVFGGYNGKAGWLVGLGTTVSLGLSR